MESSEKDSLNTLDYNDPWTWIQLIGKHLDSWKEILNEKQATIIKFTGSPNITMRIIANWETIEPNSVILRIFKNHLYDRKLEMEVVKILSDQGFSAKWYYQEDWYRIEEYFDARQITVFEMRNPVMLKPIIKIIFDINYNSELKEKILEITNNRYQTRPDIMIDEWFNKLFEKYDSIYDKITVKENK